MSFSGFVFDMIRRDKENKDALRLRRERRKLLQDKTSGKTSLLDPEITLEEFEKIARNTRCKEAEDRKHYFRTSFIILLTIFILLFVVLTILLVV